MHVKIHYNAIFWYGEEECRHCLLMIIWANQFLVLSYCEVWCVGCSQKNTKWCNTIALVGAEFQRMETGVQDGSSTLVVAMQESTGWSTKRWWNRTLVQWQSTAEHQMVVRTRTWTTDSLRQRSPPASAASLPLRAGPLYLFSFISRFEESPDLRIWIILRIWMILRI